MGYASPMTRTQTMVQLNVDLLELLDRRAAREGLSRSQLIRSAIEAFVAGDREAELDRQIVEGYERAPQVETWDRDEWGDLGGAVASLTAETLRAMTADEHEAGADRW